MIINISDKKHIILELSKSDVDNLINGSDIYRAHGDVLVQIYCSEHYEFKKQKE